MYKLLEQIVFINLLSVSCEFACGLCTHVYNSHTEHSSGELRSRAVVAMHSQVGLPALVKLCSEGLVHCDASTLIPREKCGTDTESGFHMPGSCRLLSINAALLISNF